MKRRIAAIAAVLSLVPVGQPLKIGRGAALMIGKFSLLAPLSFAKDIYEISSTARLSSIQIKAKSISGSGVIVSKSGNTYEVLSAWHLFDKLDPDEEIVIETADHQAYKISASKVKRIEGLDIALFTFTSFKDYQVAIIGNIKNIKIMDQLFAAGFVDDTFKFKQGEVIANSQIFIDNGLQLIYSNRVIPGMSGGPIFNKQGYLIGINSMTNWHKMKGIGPGTSIGVPISYYNNFISDEKLLTNSGKTLTVDDYIVKAQDIITKNGNKNTALSLLEQSLIVKKFPVNSAINIYLSHKLCTLSDFRNNTNTAYRYCKNSIQINPNQITAYINLGLIKHEYGDIHGAISYYNKAIKVDPLFSISYYNRGIAKNDLKNHKGALLDVNKAIEMDGNKPDYYTFRGNLKSKLHDDEYGAISDYTKAIKIDSNNSLAYRNRGISKERIGDMKGACSDTKKAVSLGDKDFKNITWIRKNCF